MLRLILSLVAAVLTANIPLLAQHMNEKHSPCADIVVTVDLVNCLAKARDAADAQLNAVYKSISGKLDATEVKQLITAERLWVQYRDANCVAERDLYGGGTASGPRILGVFGGDDAEAHQRTDGHVRCQAEVALILVLFPETPYFCPQSSKTIESEW